MVLRKTRNVSLTPEMEAFIDSRVMCGRYRSASEVVRAGLRLLQERELGKDGTSRVRRAGAPPAAAR